MKTTNFSLAVVFVATAFISCQKPDQIKAPTGPTFNIDLFEQNLINAVNWNNDSPIAWAYTINKNGILQRSDEFGDARNAADGQKDFTLNTEINVASITKFYTACAAMKLIYANGLTIDSKIEPYLPNSWNRGPGVDELTFADLLTHTSGLNSINSNFDSTLTYSGLRACINTGVINPKTRSYLNVNFALFRVLIPSLWDELGTNPGTINIESDPSTQITYLLYMQQNVFGPAGLSFVNCSSEPRTDATMYYNVNDGNGTGGAYYGSWSDMAGGGGYFMTPLEMAAVNAYYEHSENILPNNLKQIMKDNRIGFSRVSSLETRGNYYSHGGSISNTAGQGVLGQIAMFPINGIDCVVIMNTQGVTFNDDTGNNSLRNAIYQAYNEAWE